MGLILIISPSFNVSNISICFTPQYFGLESIFDSPKDLKFSSKTKKTILKLFIALYSLTLLDHSKIDSSQQQGNFPRRVEVQFYEF